MTEPTDLSGQGPAQGSLFGAGDNRLQMPRAPNVPDRDKVRRRIKAVLEKMRSAEKMPWSEREARMWQIVFPNMSKWLPEDEAERLRFEFAREMERLERAA